MASITRFYALILSTVLLLSGVPGFFPDVPSFQVLVSFFALTLVHSVVHFVVGLLGLMITALASDQSVRVYTIGIALLYGALMVIGLIGVNFTPIIVFNSADNWLHGSIFVLSLGVFLAGIAEERSSQRKAYLEEGLPQAQWAAPSGRADRASITAAAPSQARAVWQANMDAAPSAQGPWHNQSQLDQPTADPWGQGSAQGSTQGSWQDWRQYEQQPSQPSYQQPPNQPFSQPFNQPPDPSRDFSRDPWTRAERQAPYHQPQPPQRPASSPSRDQQPQNPWSRNPSQPVPQPQSQWPQSQPQPPSQPPQGPSPWSPWPQDSQPQDGQRPSQAREQWPLDEWESRPLQ